MPDKERNSWDKANRQGENHTDFNRHKSEEEYDEVRQEPARTENPVGDKDAETTDDISAIATNHINLANSETFDFLSFGTSDEDIQI